MKPSATHTFLKENGMGRVTVKALLSNNRKVQVAAESGLPSDQVPQFELDAVVDTGSTSLVIPRMWRIG
jgi:hypothetical protein